MPITTSIKGQHYEFTLAEARKLVADLQYSINMTTDFSPEQVNPPRVNQLGNMNRDSLFKFFDQFYETHRRDRRAGALFSYLLSQHEVVNISCGRCGGYSRGHTCDRINFTSIRRSRAAITARSIAENRQKLMASITGRKDQLRHDMDLLLTHLSI